MIPIGMAGQHKLTAMEPAPITADEIPAVPRGGRVGVPRRPGAAPLERMRKMLEPERTLVLRDGERIVAGDGDLLAPDERARRRGPDRRRDPGRRRARRTAAAAC